MDELADLKKRVADLEKQVAAIKRVRLVAQNLTAQEMADSMNAKMMRPAADKAVRLREDKSG